MQFCSYCQQVSIQPNSIKPNFLKIRAELTEIWLIEFSNFGTLQLPTCGRAPLISPHAVGEWAGHALPPKIRGCFQYVDHILYFFYLLCSIFFLKSNFTWIAIENLNSLYVVSIFVMLFYKLSTAQSEALVYFTYVCCMSQSFHTRNHNQFFL